MEARRQIAELWLEFELWSKDEEFDPNCDVSNVSITLGDGRRYALNVWTFKYLELARQEQAQDPASASSLYVVPPDLLVENLDRALLERVFDDLIEKDLLLEAWRVEG